MNIFICEACNSRLQTVTPSSNNLCPKCGNKMISEDDIKIITKKLHSDIKNLFSRYYEKTNIRVKEVNVEWLCCSPIGSGKSSIGQCSLCDLNVTANV